MGTISKCCEENSIDKILNKLMLCGSKFNVNHQDWWLFSRSNFDITCQNEPYHTINLLLNTSSGRFIIRVFGVTLETGIVSSFDQVVSICYKSFNNTVACFGLDPSDEKKFVDQVPPFKSEKCSNYYTLGEEKTVSELSGRGQCDQCKKERNQENNLEKNQFNIDCNDLPQTNVDEYLQSDLFENGLDVNRGEKVKVAPFMEIENESDSCLDENTKDLDEIANNDACFTEDSSHIDDIDIVNEGKLQCSECHLNFSNLEKLNKHIRKRHVGEHECEFCKKRFFSRRILSDHKVTHTKDRPYTCEECGATFGFNSTYKVHLKTHQRKLAKTKGLIDKKLYYECDECSKKFTQIGGLHRHRRHVHDKKFEDAQCDLCGANFRTPTLFNQHFQRFHADSPKFQCKVCSVPFGRKEHLVRHMLTHDISTAHICPHCGRSFKRKDGLIVHLRTHTGDRPFKCSYSGCLWAGLDSSSFSRHKKTVHGLIPASRCRKTQARDEQSNVGEMKEKEVVIELVQTNHLETIEIVEPLVQPLDYSQILETAKFMNRPGRVAIDHTKESDAVGCSITQEKSGQQQQQFEMTTQSLIKEGLLFGQTH